MVQVLPRQPTFLERATPYLSQIGEAGGAYLRQSGTDRMQQELLNKLNDPNTNPMEYASIVSRLPKEQQAAYLPYVKEKAKESGKIAEKAEKAEFITSSVDDMRKLLKYTGSTMVPGASFNAVPGGLNRKGLEKRNEFDALAASAASFYRDLETKGQLPLGLFEKVILPRLPSSSLSERENIGRLNALEALAKKYAGVSFKKENASSPDKMQKVEKGTKLTNDVIDKLLDQTNNDFKKAEELARGLGYEF